MRRMLQAAAVAATAVALVAAGTISAQARPAGGRFDQPRDGFAPARTVLRTASPRAAGPAAAGGAP